MAGSIFMTMLKRGRRATLYWGIGLAFLIIFMAVFIGDAELLKQYAEIVETMPPVMLAMVGLTDAANLATPEGFMSYGYFTYALMMLVAYGVAAGLTITASEEDNGTMDVLLTLPVPRWRVIIEKFAAQALMIAAMLAFSSLVFIIAEQFFRFGVDPGFVIQGTIIMYAPVLLTMAFTAWAATVVRRRGAAMMLGIAFAVGSYLLNFLANATVGTVLESLDILSFWAYANTDEIITNGFNVLNVVVLMVATAVLVVASVWFWERRDVGV